MQAIQYCHFQSQVSSPCREPTLEPISFIALIEEMIVLALLYHVLSTALQLPQIMSNTLESQALFVSKKNSLIIAEPGMESAKEPCLAHFRLLFVLFLVYYTELCVAVVLPPSYLSIGLLLHRLKQNPSADKFPFPWNPHELCI